MKKTLLSLVMILLIISLAISSYAIEIGEDEQEEVTQKVEVDEETKETTPKVEVKFKQAETNSENTIKLVLSLGKFTEVKENAMLGYEAKLNYQEEIFETVETKDVKGLNGWTATYSPITKAIIGDPIVGKENTEIAEITFTLKEGIETKKAIISLTNFLLSDDDENELYTTNLSVEIKIENQEQQQPQQSQEMQQSQSNPEQSSQVQGTNVNHASATEETNDDNTTANTIRLPKAGGTIIIIGAIAIMIFIATGAISGKGYIGYLKDTHKQLKK